MLFAVLEQPGRTTSDTKATLMTDPVGWLHGTFSLWNPLESFGDLQNQAYGYLFPMGPFFAGVHALRVPDWLVERIWSVALIAVAWEGTRLVCRRFGLGPWAAWVAGAAYALCPRMLSEVGTRSAEIHPGAVLPWVLLPLLLVFGGRIRPVTGALASAAAFACGGAVNGTATVAPLPLIVVFLLWGVRQRLAPRRLLVWWPAAMVAASVWWGGALVLLSKYSPPFFDYVEDAPTTTSTSGFDASLRGVSNWVGYLSTGAKPSWPAAWSLTYDGTLVLATGVIAGFGLAGLASMRGRWRAPLAMSAILGLVCLTIAHTSQGWLQSPLGPHVQLLLDHPFALLRNVAKVDPVLRLPLAVGVGAACARLAEVRRGWHRPRTATVGVLVLCAALVASVQPVFALQLRTPGWKQVPSYWTQTADYLARRAPSRPGQETAWIVPGSGFGVQPWGWTLDEPMSLVAKTPWVTRSQVPLVPSATIRMLGGLEDLIDSGAGSPRLGRMLARTGIGYVVVRHDLQPGLPEQPSSSLVSIALARSGDLHRVATFGSAAGSGGVGPQIELFRVDADSAAVADPGGFEIAPVSAVARVSSGPADVLEAVGAGVLSQRPAIVRGDSGRTGPVQFVGDDYQLRERQFGLAHDAEGPVLSPTEPRHKSRQVENYPGAPGAAPVTARYRGIEFAEASTSQGYVTTYGSIRPEQSPYAAVDGDPRTSWTTGYLTDPDHQWWQVRLDRARTQHVVRIHSPLQANGDGVRLWAVTAGGHEVLARTDPATGIARADLGGVRAQTVRITVRAVQERHPLSQISVSEVDLAGTPAPRSLVVPAVPTTAPVRYLFHARAETRACVPTLLGPDCSPGRYRAAEEGSGIDRTITLAAPGRFRLDGSVVARTSLDPDQLLTPWKAPVVMHASSTYFGDPTVSARMAYDGSPTTSWIADGADATPALTVDFRERRRIDRITLSRPAAPAVPPIRAVLIAGAQRRVVDLTGLGTFRPLRAKHLRIVLSNPHRQGAPIGLGDLALAPGRSVAPLHGATRTGAVCGFGPNVFIDGHRHTTDVAGVMGDVESAGSLALRWCGKPVRLTAGVHHIRVVSTSQFQPVQATLKQTGVRTAGSGHPRTLTVLSDSATTQRVRVGPGAESLLSTHRNSNAGWRATLDGRRLATQQVDGWAQGWIVPAGQGGVVRIRYAPQRTYSFLLVGGLLLLALVLLAAVALLIVDLRRAPSSVAPRTVVVRQPGRLFRGAMVIAGIGAGWVLGGLPGAIGTALACVLVRLRRVPIALGGVLVAAGAGWTALGLHLHGPRAVPDASDLLAGTGAVLLLVLALVLRGADEE